MEGPQSSTILKIIQPFHLSYMFVEAIPLLIDKFKPKKVLQYQKNLLCLAKVQQDIFCEPYVQSKYY